MSSPAAGRSPAVRWSERLAGRASTLNKAIPCRPRDEHAERRLPRIAARPSTWAELQRASPKAREFVLLVSTKAMAFVMARAKTELLRFCDFATKRKRR